MATRNGQRVLNLATSILKAAVVAAFAIIVVTAMAQVIARYAFNHPFAWAEELVRLANIWCVLLAVGFGVGQSAHFSVNVLTGAVSERLRRVLDIGAHMAMAVIASGMLLQGIVFVQKTMLSATPMLSIPYGVAYAAVPIGFGIALLFSLGRLLTALQG